MKKNRQKHFFCNFFFIRSLICNLILNNFYYLVKILIYQCRLFYCRIKTLNFYILKPTDEFYYKILKEENVFSKFTRCHQKPRLLFKKAQFQLDRITMVNLGIENKAQKFLLFLIQIFYTSYTKILNSYDWHCFFLKRK